MATRIPLPGNGAEYLQKGVESGTNLWQQLLGQGLKQQAMQQEWQQHLRNAAIREQQEERLRALQPWQMEALRLKVENLKNQESLSPEQKRAQRMEEFREKEDYKAKQRAETKAQKKEEDYFKPTNQVITQAQKSIIAINTIEPLLKDLIDISVPGVFEKKFKPAKAAFASNIQGLGVDEFQTIFGLAKNEHSTKLVENLVDRKFGENLDEYKKRIEYLYERVMHKGQMQNDVLQNKKVVFGGHGQKESPQEETLRKEKDPLGFR